MRAARGRGGHLNRPAGGIQGRADAARIRVIAPARAVELWAERAVLPRIHDEVIGCLCHRGRVRGWEAPAAIERAVARPQSDLRRRRRRRQIVLDGDAIARRRCWVRRGRRARANTDVDHSVGRGRQGAGVRAVSHHPAEQRRPVDAQDISGRGGREGKGALGSGRRGAARVRAPERLVGPIGAVCPLELEIVFGLVTGRQVEREDRPRRYSGAGRVGDRDPLRHREVGHGDNRHGQRKRRRHGRGGGASPGPAALRRRDVRLPATCIFTSHLHGRVWTFWHSRSLGRRLRLAILASARRGACRADVNSS